MNQESAAHAFERFYRADNARDAGAQARAWGLPLLSGLSIAMAAPLA